MEFEYYLVLISLSLLVSFLLFSAIFRRVVRVRTQREEEHLKRTFSSLLAEFNRISNINISILEDKIRELKAIVEEADKKACELRDILTNASPSNEKKGKYREVEKLISSGMKIEEAAKKVNMGKGEVQLIFDLSQRRKRRGIK